MALYRDLFILWDHESTVQVSGSLNKSCHDNRDWSNSESYDMSSSKKAIPFTIFLLHFLTLNFYLTPTLFSSLFLLIQQYSINTLIFPFVRANFRFFSRKTLFAKGCGSYSKYIWFMFRWDYTIWKAMTPIQFSKPENTHCKLHSTRCREILRLLYETCLFFILFCGNLSFFLFLLSLFVLQPLTWEK